MQTLDSVYEFMTNQKRIHSSRMRTSSSSPYGRGGSVLEVSLKGTPGQRPSLTHTTLDREPQTETPDRDPCTENSLDRDLLNRELPEQRPFRKNMGLETETPWKETPRWNMEPETETSQKEHGTRQPDRM